MFDCFLPQVHDMFRGDNDRVKLMLLYCGEEDLALVRAASGTLAMLASTGDKEICNKIITVRFLRFPDHALKWYSF